MGALKVNDLKKMPIGVFDSGMGGISVLATLMKELKNEKFIYFGDSANAPYGVKTVEEVKDLTIKACDFLISKHVKAIVIACNTATSASIKELRERYSIPIIGMEPALKLAVESTDYGDVAVMATPMTLKEKKFELLMKKYTDKRQIIKIPCPELVTLVEEMHTNDVEVVNAIEKCFFDIEVETLSAIVLGCTHYVFLKDALKKVFPVNIEIFDGNNGTAMQVRRLLSIEDALSDCFLSENERVEIINSKSEEFIIQSFEMLDIALKLYDIN